MRWGGAFQTLLEGMGCVSLAGLGASRFKSTGLTSRQSIVLEKLPEQVGRSLTRCLRRVLGRPEKGKGRNHLVLSYASAASLLPESPQDRAVGLTLASCLQFASFL